ncbi:EF-hand domain-containing protein [Bradyrhizobium sp. UFLA01-814]|uniref:EF-hand domain-containing protein n=1 Tax=Bradyrhizobium sp. UFLA01-814 TaxID=3023480 RepID=UPI00398B6E5E
MLFALGAASSAIDLLSSLMSSKSTTQTGSSGQGSQTTGLFAPSTGTSTSTGGSTSTGSGSAQISPLTMGALISAQSQSQTAVSNSRTAASRSDALKDLFSQIDADGNGKITQSEFENALGAGGTNTAQADDVFSKLDSNGDGSVSLDEMSQALQGHKGGHHRHHMASGSTDGSGSGAGGSGSDPLMQALDGATSTSVTNSDGSTTTTTTYADGSKVAMTTPAASSATLNAASSYNIVEQLIQRQAKAISAQNFAAISVSA